jgi:archaellum component FlaC
MGKEIHISQIRDEDGFKLPGNMNVQFRNLQSGVEYLKNSADDITIELKGVSKKLGKHTTDLSEITNKVNEIDKSLKDLSKNVSANFIQISKTFDTIIDILKTPKK